MHSRPIINTRDEPHADPEKYRRLHVIVGDANMSEISTYLKMRDHRHRPQLIEDDVIDNDFALENPVLAYRRVSRDLACRETVRLKDGRNSPPWTSSGSSSSWPTATTASASTSPGWTT